MQWRRDLTDRKLLYAKGGLFLLTGTLGGSLVLAEAPTLKVTALLIISIWSFARAYYFVFYVIEHYIDPRFRFAGLWSFAKYAMGREPVDHGSRGDEKIG